MTVLLLFWVMGFTLLSSLVQDLTPIKQLKKNKKEKRKIDTEQRERRSYTNKAIEKKKQKLNKEKEDLILINQLKKKNKEEKHRMNK